METDFKNMRFQLDKSDAIETYFNLSSPVYYKYNLGITSQDLCDEYAADFNEAYPSLNSYLDAWREYVSGLGFPTDTEAEA